MSAALRALGAALLVACLSACSSAPAVVEHEARETRPVTVSVARVTSQRAAISVAGLLPGKDGERRRAKGDGAISDAIRAGLASAGLTSGSFGGVPVRVAAGPTDGYVLTYDSTTGTWRAEAAAGGGFENPATEDLDMDGNSVTNAGGVTGTASNRLSVSAAAGRDLLLEANEGGLSLTLASGGDATLAGGNLDMDGNQVTDSGGYLDLNGQVYLTTTDQNDYVYMDGTDTEIASDGVIRLTAPTTAVSGALTAASASVSGVTSATVQPSVNLWSSGAGVSLSASQVAGHVYTNEGSTDTITPMTLPAAAAGLHATFIVQDAQGFRINCQAGDTIQLAPGVVSASGGYVAATATGSVVHLLAINGTEWIAVYAAGTWAKDDETP